MSTEERIKHEAEAFYPLADARKVLCHYNQGQKFRQEAYFHGALPGLHGGRFWPSRFGRGFNGEYLNCFRND